MSRLDAQPSYCDGMDELHDELKVLVEQWLDDAACAAQGSPLLRTRVALDFVHTNGTAQLDEEARSFRLYPSHTVEQMFDPTRMLSLNASPELIAFIDQVLQKALVA